MELTVLHTADVPMPADYLVRPASGVLRALPGLLRPGDDAVRAPCLAFVLRHPAAGVVLVDTGFHADALRSIRSDVGLPLGLMFAAMRPRAPFDTQLREAGVEPAEVGRVVMTHLHADHTSGLRLLPQARVTVARREWAAARARGAALKGVTAKHLPAEERVDLVDLEADGTPLGPFEHAVDLLGDGSIRLVATPGHTPGHLSVLVSLGDGREVLLVGDAAYTTQAIQDGTLPLLADDDAGARDTLRRLRAFGQERPGTPMVPSHDPEAWRAL